MLKGFCFAALALMLSVFSIQGFSESSKIYHVKIVTHEKSERASAASITHLLEIKKNYVTAYVNSFDLKELKRIFGSRVRVLKVYDWKRELARKRNKSKIEFPEGDEPYHTYQEVVDELNKLAKEYKTFAKVLSLGKTIEGHEQLGIKISGSGFANENKKPAMMLMGSHHSREHLSTEVPLMLAEYFLKKISTDSRFHSEMKNRIVYIFPVINIDGKIHDIQGQTYKYWRKNRKDNEGSSCKGVDLNRNYPVDFGGSGSSSSTCSDVYHGVAPFSEPETQNINEFVKKHDNIKTMISFHTYSELILYPWSYTYDPIGGLDEKVFAKMAKDMAEWNNYTPMQSSGLYTSSGDTCDWAYKEHEIFCFTFELNPSSAGEGGFYPGAEMIQKAFQLNQKPVEYLLEYTDDPYRVLNRRR